MRNEKSVITNLNTEAKPWFANTCKESCELVKRKPNKKYHTDNQG